MNPECPKCGARMAGPAYHRGGNFDCSMRGEHLHYRCSCGYETTRPPRDAKIARAELGGFPGTNQ